MIREDCLLVRRESRVKDEITKIITMRDSKRFEFMCGMQVCEMYALFFYVATFQIQLLIFFILLHSFLLMFY